MLVKVSSHSAMLLDSLPSYQFWFLWFTTRDFFANVQLMPSAKPRGLHFIYAADALNDLRKHCNVSACWVSVSAIDLRLNKASNIAPLGAK